ncbi:peptide MFS transporter [Pontibacter sp. E15-1]|uniref:peptide MFS transporter n=1 Tax=Pontibacter sp. E15-1 TaxID=2919918 RepID=UPI001F501517|nr:peptide MFS transporter [Pontibacter sp. E15-1]MCJ8163505.1 peptide MFS transporter [Pontibacter sp. E15-1]
MSDSKPISGGRAPAFIDPQDTLFGHPKGLMILFFTEMWERFSYYGMRGILVLFLVSNVNGGFSWTETEAISLYGTYTMLVYLVAIPGGLLADKVLGQKKSVMLGGFTLVAGHFLMAWPAEWAFYTALALIIAGTGMLKPNISTMVGGLYREGDSRRDSGFTIFYMGINLGAFLAALIVGYVGETIGWHYGFSLAGIGMLLGQMVFIGGQKYLRHVGNLVKSEDRIFDKNERQQQEGGNGFSKVEKDRLVLLGISFVIVLVFWAAFEQAGGLMNLYTKNYTDRYIGDEFAVNEYNTQGKDTQDLLAIEATKKVVENKQVTEFNTVGEFFGNLVSPRSLTYEEINSELSKPIEVEGTTIEPATRINSRQFMLPVAEADSATYNALLSDSAPIVETSSAFTIFDRQNEQPGFIVPASWFQSLNALFILIFGGIVATIWLYLAKTGKNPPSIAKMGIGTAIMGTGFIFMVFASLQRESSIFGLSSMWWLVLAYLFHTLGELALSPVALSYITKLAPKSLVASIMGIYFAVTGLGNKVAGLLGEAAQNMGEMEIFGGIAVVSILLGLLLWIFSGKLNRLSHGAEDKHDNEGKAQTGQLLEAELS